MYLRVSISIRSEKSGNQKGIEKSLKVGVDMNSERKIKLRHYKNNLAIGGRSYIIFGVWAVVKLLMELSMGDIKFSYLVEETVKTGTNRLFAIIFTALALAIVFATILIIHLMVGKNAVRFGKSQENRVRFYIYTSLVAIANILGLFTYPFGIMTGIDKLSPTFVAALFVDISIVIILIDLFYSAVMIEKLIKQKPVEEEA